MSVRGIAATCACALLLLGSVSAVIANGKLCLASKDEDVIVVRLGPTFEVLVLT